LDRRARSRLVLIVVAFSLDGAKLVTAGRDKSARLFDATTGQMLAARLAHEEPIFGVA
jgi:WD40 repeat protein